MCTMQCVQGCYCEEGYFRNSDGNCVPLSECKPQVTTCSLSHEVYNACGTACPLTCDNYNTPPACTEQCVPGCYCEDGYFRNSKGNCVTKSECTNQVSQPRCARSHELYTTCGTACPLTCDNYNNPPTKCTRQCVVGCACQKGYLRDNDGSCVLPAQCKPKVIEPQTPYCKGANEIYNKCGPLCTKICATKDIMIKCAEGCQPGCFCAPGYLRNSKNKCVPISRCD